MQEDGMGGDTVQWTDAVKYCQKWHPVESSLWYQCKNADGEYHYDADKDEDKLKENYAGLVIDCSGCFCMDNECAEWTCADRCDKNPQTYDPSTFPPP